MIPKPYVNSRTRKINAYDYKTGKYINSYKSIAECGRQLNIRVTDISPILHLRSNRRSINGLTFSFEGKSPLKNIKPSNTIYMFERNNPSKGAIKIFDSVSEVSKHLNRTVASINRYLRLNEKDVHREFIH